MITIYPGDRLIAFQRFLDLTLRKTVIYQKEIFVIIARNPQSNSWLVMTLNHGVQNISTHEITKSAIKQ